MRTPIYCGGELTREITVAANGSRPVAGDAHRPTRHFEILTAVQGVQEVVRLPGEQSGRSREADEGRMGFLDHATSRPGNVRCGADGKAAIWAAHHFIASPRKP